ncbi:MAG: translation elongation factor Ts [Oscillospiraceae bacterium]|jgi:elongation factor Ts|nr:translation elongation factor Ts [Oscillospiraceae bacterium]
MAFTAADVKALREKTGAGMMECKKALTQADGDMERAIDVLRERGLAAATKKAGRITAEGVVLTTYDAQEKVAVMVEVNAETDFVSKNESFKKFVADIAKTIAEQNPASVEELNALTIAGGTKTVEETRQENVLVIGENMTIRRFERLEGDVAIYTHMGGSIGALVAFETDGDFAARADLQEVGKKVAMQVAAMKPLYLSKDVVPASVQEHEIEIAKAQLAEDPKMQGKPEKVIAGAAQGRLRKYFEEVCLLQQAYAFGEKQSVGDYIKNAAKELGVNLAAVDFKLYVKGEGIEKKADDFAAEVAAAVNK